MGLLGSFGKEIGGLFGRKKPDISMRGEWENQFTPMRRGPTMQGGVGDRLSNAVDVFNRSSGESDMRRQRIQQLMQQMGIL